MDIIPQEIVKIILDFLYNKKDICNCRLVCKEWYNHFNVVKEYDYFNKLKYTHHFNEKRFYTMNISNECVKEILYLKYGKFIFKKYDNKNKLIKKITNNPPYFITSYDFFNNNIIIKELNVEKSSIISEIKYNQNQISHNNDNCILS